MNGGGLSTGASDERVAIGVDLGGTHLRVALVDLLSATRETPVRRSERKVPLGGANDPDLVAGLLAGAVEDSLQEAGHEGALVPVGIGVAGMLRGKTGIVANAPNLGWRDVNFRSLVEMRLPRRRVELYNDLNAIAYGEHVFGAGRGVDDILCVYLGTGIGAGLVCGGRLVEGASNVAGEIGHVKVEQGPSARPCGCGARGCLEAYAGGHNLMERVRAELGHARSRAVELAGGNRKDVHPGHLDQAAREGDPYAARLWDEIGPLVGVALANAVTLLNSARLILGGGVYFGAPALRERVLLAFGAMVNRQSGDACVVVDAALRDDAGILGAAALAVG
ncbi:MAG: ROK family protein [Deltaproteobacteria bacterium]|nr:ROK family protein [Deltaproteobacteria bacterium]